MASYELPDRELDRQRAALVRTGAELIDVLTRFVDAAQVRDTQTVEGLLPRMALALDEFSTSASCS